MPAGQEQSIMTRLESAARVHGTAMVRLDRALKFGGSEFETALGDWILSRAALDAVCRQLVMSRPEVKP